MKKQILIIAVIALLLCVGCAKKSAGNETVTLTVWACDGGNEQDPQQSYTFEMIKNFQEQNPDIKLDWVALGTAGAALNDKLKVAMANNQPPDIFQSWGGSFMGAFADGDKLLDLTAELSDLKVSEAAKKAMSWNGKIYGVAPFFGIAGLYVNEGKFKELGIAVPNTIEELEAAADKLLAAGIQPFACGARDKWPLLHSYMYLVNRYGGDVFAQTVKREVPFTADPYVKAALKIQEWTKKGYYGPKPLAEGYSDAQLLMQTGKAGMILSGSWLASLLTDKASTDQTIGFYPVPVFTDGIGTTADLMGMTDIGYAVSKNAESKKEAVVRFLKYAMSVEALKSEKGRVSSVSGVEPPTRITGMASEVFGKAKTVQAWWDQDLPPSVSGPVNDTIQIFMLSETDVNAELKKLEQVVADNVGPLK